MNIESLDDLFEDSNSNEDTKNNVNTSSENNSTNSSIGKIEDIDDTNKLNNNEIIQPNNKVEDAPILPQEQEEDDDYDLQKELEAKFDELFGPIDDNSNE